VSKHEIVKVRHELRRRRIEVARVEMVTPRMKRITFASPELQGFASPSPDDHVKLFFSSGNGEPVMRDYTPRAFDAQAATLVVDFALHERGPATEWARAAQVGDWLEVGGPRGSTMVPDDFDWYLLIGDEAALPSIGRRVEGLRAGVPVRTLVVIEDEGEQQSFATAAGWTGTWLVRDGSADERLLISALGKLPPGDGYVWIGAEGAVARALYSYITDELRHEKAWIKSASYWDRESPEGGEGR
jgi:NADPH-dependent ferric siderophore reductase